MTLPEWLRAAKVRVTRRADRGVRELGARSIAGHVRGRVVSGPFRNVRLGKAKTAEMLGTYELELHPILDRVGSSRPRVTINVGGGDGYYAIGMAAMWNVERVIVYEASSTAREHIAANVRLNGVEDRIVIREACTGRALESALTSNPTSFMIMDIEGAELDVLTSGVLRQLDRCIVVVESHDFRRPGCIDELRRRFNDTHAIGIVTSRSRVVRDFPYESKLPGFWKRWLMNERRPGSMQWLVGIPQADQTDATRRDATRA